MVLFFFHLLQQTGSLVGDIYIFFIILLNVQSNIRIFILNQLLSFSIYSLNTKYRQLHTKTITSNRVGPYNIDVISVLVGCLLGEAYSIKSKYLIGGISYNS